MTSLIIPKTNHIYASAIWFYLFLLIFEGALRKWVFTSLATPLLVVRDPIVIWLCFVGFKKGYLKNWAIIAIVILSFLSFFTTLIFAHQNIITTLFGWRIYLFYFPFIFIIGNILSRSDVLKMGRFIIYLSIPMTLLVIVQFYSPQSSWVNLGVGGDTDGAGFGGALGYFRPPGTFSFTSGFATFQLLVSVFIFYYLFSNKYLPSNYQINRFFLLCSLICLLVSIPFSISRTVFFQTVLIFLFLVVGLIINNRIGFRYFIFGFLFFLCIYIVISLNLLGDGLAAFISRFSSADESEGGLQGTLINRYLGSILRGFDSDGPFWGYGLGYGTNVGAKMLGLENMYTKFNSDQEWVRVVGESGLLVGISIMFVRFFIGIKYFIISWRLLFYKRDLLPWLISPAVFVMFSMGSFNATTNLGFAVFITGISLSVLKNT